MARRMRNTPALLLLLIVRIHAFIPGADGPVSNQESIEGGSTELLCDSSVEIPNDELMLLVWYKNNVPIYSFDARTSTEWSSISYNSTGRLRAKLQSKPSVLLISDLRGDDEALYHCRTDFLLAPTRNIGINLTVIVLPSQPFFLDELGNKVESSVGPYQEGDTLVLSCLVIGGRPPPRISWYSGETLVDASDGDSDIPGVRENELYLPLTRDNAAALSCRATNTPLAPPIVASLKVQLYLSAYNVSITWVHGSLDGSIQAGRPAMARCTALGSQPAPDLAWWLDHRHLTQHSNQSWSNSTQTATSFLELTAAVGDNSATLACVATNPAMPPAQRASKADVITLNVTYSPLVEVSKIGAGGLNDVVELDTLHLECEVQANPPIEKFMWYYNDIEIDPGSIWGDNTTSQHLVVEESSRSHAGRYSCAAANSVGETRSEDINIIVYYPPECTEDGITLTKEVLNCNVIALPNPDTYFWHIQPTGLDLQQLTTGSPILPLAQITGPLSASLKASCEAGNGIATQEVACERVLSLEHLRPQQPQQCDMTYERGEFQMRCLPVENATYYELAVWRMSTSNTSLFLERRGAMGYGGSAALAQGAAGGSGAVTGSWLVRGSLGRLKTGDEAGASACNRYGCSRAMLLRPTDSLLYAASPPWWNVFLEKDVGISIGAVVLVAVFILSTSLAVRLTRRPRKPVIQVLQLDDVARDYLDNIGEQKLRASCSLRSCSSGYSDGSRGSAADPPAPDRRLKPRLPWEQWHPPPDVTLTLHRESAV